MQSTTTSVPHAPAPRSGGRGPQLAFNYLPVRFRESQFSGDVVPYESREQIQALRSGFAATHVVTRVGDDLVCVPFVADAPSAGKAKTFSTTVDVVLVSRLLQEALVRVLTRKWGYLLRRDSPPVFVSRLAGRDLLEQAAAGMNVDGLHVYPEFRLDVRRQGPAGTPGIIVGLKTRYEIDLPVSELLKRGVTVKDRYVLAVDEDVPNRPYMDPRARRRTIGAVESVDGDRLRLVDASGQTEIAAQDTWLEPRKDILLDVLAIATGSKFGAVSARLAEAAFELTGAEGRLGQTVRIADALGKLCPLQVAEGVDVMIGGPVGTGQGSAELRTRRLEAPTFVFDLGGDKTQRSADQGLDRFGPFDSEGFTPKQPRIVVMTPQQYKGRVEEFMHAFRNGVPGGSTFVRGFTRKYQLTDCKIDFTTFEGEPRDAQAYRRACLAALEGPDPVHLAIVVVSDQQKQLTGDASPYLVSKSMFMSQGVPVQEVQIETIQRADLPSTLNTIALACYAKLGGTPYVLRVPRRAMAHELVIGIGRSDIQTTRLGQAERIVGITTVFSSDGHYFLSNTSKDATYDQYPQELLRSLRSCIEDVKARNAWQPEDTIRLVFHVFKPLKDQEAKAVKALVEGLTADFAGVEFAFLHISDDHEWVMFDCAGTGVGAEKKGRFVPDRGHSIRVSRSEMLITVTGPFDMKVPFQGAPQPLLLKLHRESTFSDLDYLAGQVFRFTALSWRRFYPSSRPVTILYSELIANLLGQLRSVTNWNADITSTKLRWSRWFL